MCMSISACLARIDLLIYAANLLRCPDLLTEQYPKGLGRTIEEIRQALPEARPLEKMDFSCVPAPGFCERLSALHRDQIVLTGIETHICVAQTALDLSSQGETCIRGCRCHRVPQTIGCADGVAAAGTKRVNDRYGGICGFRMAAPSRHGRVQSAAAETEGAGVISCQVSAVSYQLSAVSYQPSVGSVGPPVSIFTLFCVRTRIPNSSLLNSDSCLLNFVSGFFCEIRGCFFWIITFYCGSGR